MIKARLCCLLVREIDTPGSRWTGESMFALEEASLPRRCLNGVLQHIRVAFSFFFFLLECRNFLLELELLALFSLAILPRTRLLCVVTLSCVCHTVQHVSNKAGFGTGFQPLLFWLDASSLCDCTFLLGPGRHFTNIKPRNMRKNLNLYSCAYSIARHLLTPPNILCRDHTKIHVGFCQPNQWDHNLLANMSFLHMARFLCHLLGRTEMPLRAGKNHRPINTQAAHLAPSDG